MMQVDGEKASTEASAEKAVAADIIGIIIVVIVCLLGRKLPSFSYGAHSRLPRVHVMVFEPHIFV